MMGRGLAVVAALTALAALTAGCDRGAEEKRGAPAASAAPDAGDALPAPSSAAPSPSAPRAPERDEEPLSAPLRAREDSTLTAPPAAEAKRASLKKLADDPLLAPHKIALEQHFAGADASAGVLPSPLELQVTELGGGRRAVLAYGEPQARRPMLLAFDDQRALLWTKERPLAGTRQVVTEMVLAPGPRGEVALLWCDIPTQVVGLRKWSTDGVVLADFEVLEVDLCESLSALYWPGRGWIAAASQHGAAHAQLLDEAGKRAWGPRGNELPWAARPSAPVSIAVDSDVSLILVQVGDRPGGALNRVLAMRYDTLGTALWEKPLDLGPAPAPPASARLAVTRVEVGKIKVALGGGPVIVTSQGMILGGR